MRLSALSVMIVMSGAGMFGQDLVPACSVPKPTTIAACPLIGCSSRVADALLNQAKNRTDSASAVDDVTAADIKALTQPTDWTTGQPRRPIAATEGHGQVDNPPSSTALVKPCGANTILSGPRREPGDSDIWRR